MRHLFICCSLFGFLLIHQQSVATDKSARWISGQIKFGTAMDPDAVISGTTGDFNGDGFEDVLCFNSEQLAIAWNGLDGLGLFGRINEPGTWDWVVWDQKQRVLWTQRSNPRRIDAWTFQGDTPQVSQTFEGSAKRLHLTAGLGVTVLSRIDESLELLQANGEVTEILPRGSALSDAVVADLQPQAGIVFLEDKESGKLGVSTKVAGLWQGVTWWNETAGTQQWQMLQDEEDNMYIVGLDRNQLWLKGFNKAGKPVASWRAETELKENEFWPVQITNGSLRILRRTTVTYNVIFETYDLQSGNRTYSCGLNELDRINGLLTPDLDGDGIKDIIHPRLNSEVWDYYLYWGDGGDRRLFWKNSQIDFGNSSQIASLPRTWRDALGDVDDLEEVWTHRGHLICKRRGQWIRITENQEIQTNLDENEDAAGSCFQLFIPFIDLGANEWKSQPGIAEITPGRWYHLAFMRNQDLHTEVWLDGERIFDGQSEDRQYVHNMLIFGGAYGRAFGGFGKVSLDRISLFGSQLDITEIETEMGPGLPESYRYLTERWEFENQSLTGSILGSDVLKVSSPRRVKGVSGQAVAFDGMDDALQVFVPISNEAFTLSFFFKLDETADLGDHTLATLYGMYNTAIQLHWKPRNRLIQRPVDGSAIQSPSRFTESMLEVPGKSRPFTLGSMLYFLDEGGLIYKENPLGWAPIRNLEAPPRTALGNPVVWNDRMYTVDDAGSVYSWSPESGWSENGDVPFSPETEWVQIPGGVFAVQKDGWTYEPWGGMKAVTPVDTGKTLRAISWNPGGYAVELEQEPLNFWHPTKRSVKLAAAPAFFQVESTWVDALLIWGWVLSAIIFLSIALFLKRIRQWFESGGFGGLQEVELAESLRDNLRALANLPDNQFDTDALDNALSQSPHDTDETRRTRRSRFIKECNQWSQLALGLDAIERKKDPTDRRRSIYALNAKVVERLQSED